MAEVNNAIYSTLGDRWYTAQDDPVALLRAESRARNPWILKHIQSLGREPESVHVLDVGCGAGFCTGPLAKQGYAVTGLDFSASALEVARANDDTGKIKYVEGDALKLPFADGSFDVVISMDVLEHVAPVSKAVEEASRVLKPGGLFLYYTFNRNFFAWLILIKGVEWVVRNTPAHLHVYKYLVKPSELAGYLRDSGMQVGEHMGLRPKLGKPFFKMLTSGVVPTDLEFKLTKSLWLGYLGRAEKPA